MTAGGVGEVHWDDVSHLFYRAMELPASEREGWLQKQQPENVALQRRVLELLVAMGSSEGKFQGPSSDEVLGALDEFAGRSDLWPKIDSFELHSELGRGGMGTVYRATQLGDGFEREVAIKVLRHGIDTEDVLRRFATERRILATLQHPNIAQLYDAGMTADGRPYLAMELVEGTPITDYSESLGLTTRQRVELLLEVAAGVQAAHARLVVHRDIKPSNVLVNKDGRAKLLDFGIAKLLTPEPGEQTAHTRTGLRVFTPQYAAPEQVEGELVSLATDVFQLGGLLFRLLTGRPPAALNSSATPRRSSARALGAAEPASIGSSLKTADERGIEAGLGGDLRIVLAKAMHSEPERRYRTVADFSDDLRNYLDDRPILARPESWAYRASKFVRRHRWVVPVVATALLALAAFGVVVVRYTRQLARERAIAQEQANRARGVQDFLVSVLRRADVQAFPDAERGPDLTVVDAMDQGVLQLQSALPDQPRVQADVLLAIAQTYKGLGEYGRGLPVAQRALALFQRLDGELSKGARTSLGLVGVMQGGVGQMVEAEATLLRHLKLALATGQVDVDEVAAVRVRLGHLYRDSDRLKEARSQVEAILGSGPLEAHPGHVPSDANLGEATRVLADLQRLEGDPVEAEQTARNAIGLKERAFGSGPSTPLALAYGTLADSLADLEQYSEAEAAYRQAIDWLELVAGTNYSDRLVQVNNLAVMLLGMGKFDDAEAMLAEAVVLATKAKGPDHAVVGDLLQNRGVTLGRLERWADAREAHERAAPIFATNRAETDPRRAFPTLSLAGVYLGLGLPEKARDAANQALEVFSATLPLDHHVVAVARCRIGRALVALGDSKAARAHFEAAVFVLRQEGVSSYRRECLQAASAWFESVGDSRTSAELQEVLASLSD